MTSPEVLSDLEENNADRRKYLKRTCTNQAKPGTDEKHETSEEEDSSDDGKEDSDEDFSLNNKPKKKKYKKASKSKERSSERAPKKKIAAPSFDQVMEAQINHAFKLAKYDYYEDYASELSDESEEPMEEPEVEREQTPPRPDPPKEKRKKVIIYPWNPIGITGGRPMNKDN